jgi:hypothetical protein
MDYIEKIWDFLLSRDPELIQKAYDQLSEKDQEAIMNHLTKMANETEWHFEQKLSAQTAIDAINGLHQRKK